MLMEALFWLLLKNALVAVPALHPARMMHVSRTLKDMWTNVRFALTIG
jgi:hypothetical protein